MRPVLPAAVVRELDIPPLLEVPELVRAFFGNSPSSVVNLGAELESRNWWAGVPSPGGTGFSAAFLQTILGRARRFAPSLERLRQT